LLERRPALIEVRLGHTAAGGQSLGPLVFTPGVLALDLRGGDVGPQPGEPRQNLGRRHLLD